MIIALLLAVSAAAASALPLESIQLPPGFSIEVFTDKVPGARSLALSPGGTLFIGTQAAGKVYAVRDGKVYVIASGLFLPNGVAFRDGDLYVAEVNRVLRYRNIEDRLFSPPPAETVFDELPSDPHHGWKFIRFGPDGRLYIPIGAPCNVCDAGDPYASITRIGGDGTSFEIYARGVRNTVGFDWQPGTGVLWFTDNGRDYLGDDRPPDELNRASQKGLHFGFPYRHGREIADPEFGGTKGKFTPPVVELGPHVAALGMRFYTGKMFPPEYRDQIFIAEHGSWNRSQPIGYRVTLVKLDRGGQPVSYEPFAQGWLKDGQAWGRPVDVEVMGDGSLLVSDDKAGAVYRISYRK